MNKIDLVLILSIVGFVGMSSKGLSFDSIKPLCPESAPIACVGPKSGKLLACCRTGFKCDDYKNAAGWESAWCDPTSCAAPKELCKEGDSQTCCDPATEECKPKNGFAWCSRKTGCDTAAGESKCELGNGVTKCCKSYEECLPVPSTGGYQACQPKENKCPTGMVLCDGWPDKCCPSGACRPNPNGPVACDGEPAGLQAPFPK